MHFFLICSFFLTEFASNKTKKIIRKKHCISFICHYPLSNEEVELIYILLIVHFKLMVFCSVTNWKHLSGIMLLHLLHFLI